MSYFDEVRLIVILVLIFNDIYNLLFSFVACVKFQMKKCMEDAHRADIKNGKDKKHGFSLEVELMWQKGSLWKSAAKTLMNTMYFQNGNIFGSRAAAHRIIQEHKILYLAMNLFVYIQFV